MPLPERCIFEQVIFRYTGGGEVNHIYKLITPVHIDIGRHLIYQNVQLFIKSKTDILTITNFKYSLQELKKPY